MKKLLTLSAMKQNDVAPKTERTYLASRCCAAFMISGSLETPSDWSLNHRPFYQDRCYKLPVHVLGADQMIRGEGAMVFV